MLVQIASDLHSEFYRGGAREVSNILEPVGDVLVLAGDIIVATTKQLAKDELQHFCNKWKRVVYVAGNHEHYGTNLDQVKEALEYAQAQIPNLSVLDSSMVEIEGKRFLGGTLWFPNKPDPARIWELFSDFGYIKNLKERHGKKNKELIDYLLANTRPGDFVITHHLPMFRCVHPIFVREPTNLFFVGDADEVVVTKEPKYWVYGHTHTKQTHTFMKTELICNPRGYPGQRSTAAFDPKLTVEY